MQLIEKRELARHCISNFEAKEHIQELNYMFNLQNPVWVLSRLLDLEQYPAFVKKTKGNPDHKRFVSIAFANGKAMLTDIVEVSKQYQK